MIMIMVNDHDQHFELGMDQHVRARKPDFGPLFSTAYHIMAPAVYHIHILITSGHHY